MQLPAVHMWLFAPSWLQLKYVAGAKQGPAASRHQPQAAARPLAAGWVAAWRTLVSSARGSDPQRLEGLPNPCHLCAPDSCCVCMSAVCGGVYWSGGGALAGPGRPSVVTGSWAGFVQRPPQSLYASSRATGGGVGGAALRCDS